MFLFFIRPFAPDLVNSSPIPTTRRWRGYRICETVLEPRAEPWAGDCGKENDPNLRSSNQRWGRNIRRGGRTMELPAAPQATPPRAMSLHPGSGHGTG